jgi:hypothetical protein
MSPSADLSAVNNLQYIQNSSLPVHIRNDVHAASPASTPSSGYNNGIRPTSHPTGYAPPQTLEPSIEHHQGPGSAGGSPHMGSVGWQSPSHGASPTHSATGNGYSYPDPEAYQPGPSMGQMFYGGAPAMRRPGSAEPGSSSLYDVKPTRPGELWAAAQ